MSVTQLEKARRFRALHEGSAPFLMPNPWDAGSTRLLATLGFPALATSSFASAAALGRRDGGITRHEAIAHARSLVEATDLPVSADLENGFGDSPAAVGETIRLAAATGLVGGSIEDATGNAAQPLFDLDTAVSRVTAAVVAARSLSFPFTVTARAENFFRGRPDLDDTIRRLRAYENAGADVLFAPALPDLDAVRAVCAAVSKPVNFMAGLPGKSFSVAELAAAGVRRISLGASLHRAALGGFLTAANEILHDGTFTFTDSLLPAPRVYELLGSPPPSPAQ